MALAHVTPAGRELARSMAFFHEVLGWTPIGRPRNNAAPAAWLQIVPGRSCTWSRPRVPALAVRARVWPAHRASLPRPGFPTLKERLIAHGAEVIEPLRDTPFDRFFFGDSNGYLFEVLEQEWGAENLVR